MNTASLLSDAPLPSDAPTLSGRQIQFANYLMAGFPLLNPALPGLSAKAAAAATGNATQESNVQSVDLNKSEGSDGAMQWLGPRLDAMKAWTTQNFGGWQSLKAQAAFFAHECSTGYPSLWTYLTSGADARSVATLTYDICDYYERPNAKLANLDNRYALISAQPPTPTVPQPAPEPTPTPAPAPAPTPAIPAGLDAATIDGLVQTLAALLPLLLKLALLLK